MSLLSQAVTHQGPLPLAMLSPIALLLALSPLQWGGSCSKAEASPRGTCWDQGLPGTENVNTKKIPPRTDTHLA